MTSTNALEMVVLGLSHRTAPLDVRERLAVTPEDLLERLRTIVGLPGLAETTVLSTCNRVEIYAAVSDRVAAFSSLKGHLLERLGRSEASGGELEPHLYRRHGQAAVHHLFRVTASLDSLVVGEPQILGQVKDAFQKALEAGTTGPVLGNCFPRAFRVARRIRRETGIGTESVSISSVAVDLARRVFAGFERRHVLLIGAGKMSALAARALHAQGADVRVTNRTAARAEALAAELGCSTHPFEKLEDALAAADIVITSTGARLPILNRDALVRVQTRRKRRPLVIIDIAVPRDVDPLAADIEGLFLWDIDDLQKETASHMEGRRREAEQAETLIEREVIGFIGSVRGQAVGPTIQALRTRFSEVARQHAERTKQKIPGLDARAQAEIDRMAEAVVNELLHAPQVALKRGAAAQEGDYLAGAAQRLFDLPVADDADRAGGDLDDDSGNDAQDDLGSPLKDD